MTVTFKLGPTAASGSAMAQMPWPAEWTATAEYRIGGVHTTAASVFLDVFTRKREWQYSWNMIPSGSLATLRTEYERDAVLDMSPVDEDDTTYYKVIVDGDFRPQAKHVGVVGSPRYNVTLTFKET